MPQLSKAQFAALVRDMPDASEDEILAEARKREAASYEQPKDDRTFLGKAADTVIPTGLRVLGGIGGAIAGGAASAPTIVGLPAGVMVGGGAGAALGEELAQGYEQLRGLRDPGFNLQQIATQGILGAAPVLGKAGSVAKTALSRAGQGAVLGGVGSAATELAEGHTPSLGTAAIGAGLGGVLGAGAGAVEARAFNRANQARRPQSPPLGGQSGAGDTAPASTAGARREVPGVEQMAGDVPPEFHAVLDRPSSFADPSRFVDPQNSPLLNEDYGIVSWGNPGRSLSAEENAQRMAALAEQLKQEGYSPIRQKGVFDGEEESFLVPGMNAADAKRFGRMGEQVSVISRDGYHRLADDATFSAQGLKFDQAADNYYSVVDLPGHGPVKYQMAFPDEAFGPPAASGTPTAPEPSVPPSAVANLGTERPSQPFGQDTNFPATMATGQNVAQEKARVDAFRRQAAEQRVQTEGALALKPAVEETPQQLTDYRNSGLAFKNFFSDVTKGAEQYRPQAEWKPLLKHDDSPFPTEYAKHTGNFDNHIATSIPAFKDVQIRKGAALAKVFGPGTRMLDIGASEGSFAKSVTALSGGKVQTVALDPNPDMANFFRTKSNVPGSEYVEEAFHQGFEDGGRVIPAHNPQQPYDIVHESMAFQFISPQRAEQIAEAKRLMKPGGVFLTEQKLLNAPEVWKHNEAIKDRHFKNLYYGDDQLKAKQAVVKFDQDPNETKAVGMVDNMVQAQELESLLQQQFKHVAQYFDSGNFKGYIASDDPQKLVSVLREMGDLRTPFSTEATPRILTVKSGRQPEPAVLPRTEKVGSALRQPDPPPPFNPNAQEPPVERRNSWEPGQIGRPRGGSTALSVAAPSAAMAIPDDPDSEWDDYARAGLMGAGVLGLGKVVLPKGTKAGRVMKTPEGFAAVHPQTGRTVKIGLGETPDNLRKPLVTEGIPPEWEAEFKKVGLRNGQPPPQAPMTSLVAVTKDGQLRFGKQVEGRLRTLYRFGDELFNKDGGAEWLENGILDDLLKFLPLDDPAVASHRLFGATSPAQDVSGNLMDTLRVALRTKQAKERGNLNLSKENVQDTLMRGIGNRPSKAPNVQRALTGEELQSYTAPDPMPAGKTEDLAKGMAGKPDAIPFDMWWARALGMPHDAQPLNGLSYKLFFDAGARVAKTNGVEPFPFMAKVWAAMKELHSGGGGVAPNKLARDIGLGQADLFDGSTTPGGEQGKKLLRQIMTGGAELLGPTGVSSRATKALEQKDNAKRLLGVAEQAGFKGLRVQRDVKTENLLDKEAYKRFVTNRPDGMSMKEGQQLAQKWVQEQMKKLKGKSAKSVEALGQHLVKDWTQGTKDQPRLPLDTDRKLIFQRLEEVLDPARADKKKYRSALQDTKRAGVK
jgi:SAM-dependent methyltransferase